MLSNRQQMRLTSILRDGEPFYKLPIDDQLQQMGLVTVSPELIEVCATPLGKLHGYVVGVDMALPRSEKTILAVIDTVTGEITTEEL